MKRMVLLFLSLAMVLACTACAGEKTVQPSFYYLRTEDTIAYGQEDALIVPVPQDISPEVDLEILLQLYLDGPTEEKLRNPIPKGTYLLSIIEHEDSMVIVLSREFSTLDGIQLTLAGACLAATCHDLAGVERIKIRCGESTYNFEFSNFMFLDRNPES